MTPERHQQIKRLFLAAVELAPSEAQRFLDSACGDDRQLRTEVQSLLDHHRTETLLAAAANSAETAGPPDTTLLSSYQGEPEAGEAEAARAGPPSGTMIAGRYRLVAPLGRGGMGIVYRADDTELSQTIALKFLSPALQQSPGAIDLLRREVRIARQITHPNVVRIFDIGTSDSDVFISMEFVAGEDLASLVRRVGPLPANKVLQIARQLAAGLAAAQEAGILHRDLKPANVMIDGAGNVRILDFGIAAPLDDERALRRPSGTPGFLAPELLAGHRPSPRSDLFAWGLVVYYAAMGKLPRTEHVTDDEAANDPLKSANLDADLADCVRSCLEADPARRPNSAHDLVAALSADDPLRDALHAGRVPSPELVAAASSWQPSIPRLNWLVAAGLALLAIIVLLADRTLFLTRCGLVKSPEALQDIAEQTLIGLGHEAPAGPVLSAVIVDTSCLQYVRAHPELPTAWQKVKAGEIPAVSFWYRQGDPRLPPPTLLGDCDWQRLAEPLTETATVRLDGRGKLLSACVPLAVPSDQRPARAVNWQNVFELAGLRLTEFHATDVYRWPPLFADEVQAWEGPFRADASKQVKVTAASVAGRIVFFDVDQPWEPSPATTATIESTQSARFIALRTALWLAAIGVGLVLAWRHVHDGHAEWRGAWRITAGVLLLVSLYWLCGSRHTFDPAEELAAGLLWLQTIVFCGAVAGVGYLAVEPAARRWWPWSIITMRRLLEGRLADRGIWADVLLGQVVGLAALLMRQVCTLTNQLLGVSVSGLNDFDLSQNLLDHFGLRYKIAVFITALLLAVLESLFLLTVAVALRRLTKSTLVAAMLLIVIFASLAIFGRGILSPIDWLARTLLSSIAAWLLLRVGLLATITALTTFYALNNTPITLDWSRWYAVTGFVVVTSVAALLVICWRMARQR